MNFKAVIFDLDGVISKTALVHSAAWTRMFNDYLKSRESRFGEPYKEFSHELDYLPYVDGKPRYKGVQSFLESRSINIPWGDPSDSPDSETICGLGNKKNEAFNQILKEEGVQIYESTLHFIHELKNAGIRIGVASSSKNCKQVLESAGIIDLFETLVDGEVSAELGLKGKPEPDIFTVSADNLNAFYDQTVIVEDAVSGVQAGANGNFGLVLGIAREENEKELYLNGADLVVSDLSETNIEKINEWFEKGFEDAKWSISYKDYDLKKEKSREALLATGNGYMGTRGAMEEISACENNYPGTYIAGLYNRLTSKVGDRDIENEDFVNCPNWLPLTFKIENGNWFNPNEAEILDFHRILDFRNGLLTRKMKVRDVNGNETEVISQRISSMANPHLAAISYCIKPLNYSGKITLKSSIDGHIINDGVARYRDLNQKHLQQVEKFGEGNYSSILVETTQSKVKIAETSKLLVSINNQPVNPIYEVEITESKVANEFELNCFENQIITIEKIVSIYSSKDFGIENPLISAKNDLEQLKSFNEVLTMSEDAWKKLWEEMDIEIDGDRKSQMLLRLHLYHLMVSASPHNKNIDASFTARGLHGEAYRGHIFWDELFIIPFYNIHFPEVAKASLLYRYHRLEKAREYAKAHGYEGAMIPWQTGSDGREETQIMHLNPLTGQWGDDFSSLQRHVGLAVAYNVWQYFHTTNDLAFLSDFGAEMFLDICRFWASKCKKDDITGRFSIDQVMGPDEFHEGYPGTHGGGLKDNSYTNIMVCWCFQKATELLDILPENKKSLVLTKLKLTKNEINLWWQIAYNLNIAINKDGIIAQYEGYFELKELDWNYYKEKYGNIYRLDRILKAEGKSADVYKVAKQADTLMTFYNLDIEEVSTILNRLKYDLPEDYFRRNLEYYLARTSHGSTLSRVVHAKLAAMGGNHALSWQLFSEALESDYLDIQGGTTGEGIHLGVMAGTIMIALTTFAGLDLRSDEVKINPNLPKTWRKIKVRIRFKGKTSKVLVTKDINKYIIQEVKG